MNTTRTVSTSTILTKQSAALVLKALHGSRIAGQAIKPTFICIQHQQPVSSRRQFSTTRRTAIREFFPEPDAPNIRTTKAAWSHPMYTYDQMNSVVVAHKDATTVSDRVAMLMVRILRFGLDLATGYKHDKAVALNAKDPAAARQKYGMTERKYMIR